ncbi:MAG: hypothetical protein AUJ23_03675 [Candidatus Magasanikbacteria bacterium CG1_02_32_51]|uniref:Uncharacterized protein n=1 Tax=Candidatus Magasanikbacteria bacterium CG1_02_32_51 TaxID=1805238 RepID=A0A1J4U1P5_9BACT|nr:MAG: hypothetical protein AUJ23_03675 [Candidatus Magasanikbacteria bacterium CG1_02_32_51]
MKTFFEKLKNLLNNNLFIFLLFLVIALVIYYPLFKFTFFQDDFVWLSNTKDIWAGKVSFNNIFTLKISNFVMPIIYSYFTIAYKIFGLSSFWFYLTNIILHTANTFILFKLLKNFFSKNIAITSAIIFLTLRYSIESVSWISAITVLLTTLFLLSIGLLWISFLKTNNKIKYFFILFLTLLLILTKEWSVLLLPFLLILTILFQLKQNKKIIEKKHVLHAIPIGIMFLVYILIEFSIQSKSSVLLDKGFYVLGWHAVPNIINNIFLTFLPILNIAHNRPFIWIIASSIFLISSLVLGFYLLIKNKNPLVLGIIWMIISFLPTSFFTWNPYVSRYSYIPAIGAVIFIGYGLKFIKDQQKIKLLQITTILIGVYCVFNIFFTYKTLYNSIETVQKENKYFTQALYKIENKINKQDDLAIYNKTPHTDFILPEILHSLINISTEKVHVIKDLQECADYQQCLFWNSDKKEIELL